MYSIVLLIKINLLDAATRYSYSVSREAQKIQFMQNVRFTFPCRFPTLYYDQLQLPGLQSSILGSFSVLFLVFKNLYEFFCKCSQQFLKQVTKPMKDKILFSLFTFLLILPSLAMIDHQRPTIISVSTIAGLHKGSQEGGTILVIRGTTFNPDFTKNRVWVGPYPCELMADGSAENSLSCRTTYPYDPQQRYNLKIMVAVDGKAQVQCATEDCLYSYHWDQTPIIYQICPKTAIPNEYVNIFGVHRITDLGDALSNGEGQVEKLKIGSDVCSLIDVDQKTTINSGARQPINCQVSEVQEAGEHEFIELVDPGNARFLIRNHQTSFLTGQNYTQRTVPVIQSVSANSGGDLGQKLTVEGLGFTNNLENYDCQVSGETCTVDSLENGALTISVPPKDGGNTEFGKLPKHASDVETQEQYYLGGGGALYTRYTRNAWKSPGQWLDFIHDPLNTDSLEIVEQKVLTELGSPEKWDGDDQITDYVEYVRGYFYAHEAGDYTFTGNCDDRMIMKLSKYPGTANLAHQETLIDIDIYNYHHFMPYLRENVTMRSQTKTLEQGYYYYEIILVNYGGQGFFKVDVQVPEIPSIDYVINPTWEIQKLTIKPSAYLPEILKLTVLGTSGKFRLYYNDPNQDNKLYEVWFNVGASAEDVEGGLGSLRNIPRRIVSLELFDSAGAPTLPENNNATKYVYTIEIINYRDQTIKQPLTDISQLVADGFTANVMIEKTQSHSDPLSGTFQVLVDNVPLEKDDGSTEFDYNTNPYYISRALNLLFGTIEVDALRVIDTYAEDSIEIIIEYPGVYQVPPTITLSTLMMTGGDVGATIESSVETIQGYSAKPYYSPIPFDFLHVASESPSLTLKVNSIPAVCKTDCSYQIDAANNPVVSSYSRTDEVITLGITDPASIGFTTDDITVSLLGTPCSDVTGTIDSFTCSLAQNADDSVQIVGGTQKVVVHVNGVGYADSSAASDEDIALTSSLSPSASTSGGLIAATLTGSGFPIDKNNADGLEISICENVVTDISSISNTQIKFVIPPKVTACTGSNSQISFNGKTSSITFAYDDTIAPTIASLSKTSSSPILKSTLTITGTNYGDSTNTKVYLYQDGVQKYELTTVSVTSTEIQCILGGGKSGAYDVVVLRTDLGASIPDSNSEFEYRIFVDSIDPVTGHKGGGYSMRITGQNFATASGSSFVFVGNGMNSYCEITSITETEINCVVPRMLEEYAVGDALDVVVTGRILQESVCSGTCSFSFTEKDQVTVTDLYGNVSPDVLDFKKGDNVNIQGVGLSSSTVSVGGEECVITAQSDTEINCTYPSLAAGTYQILIKNSNGWNYPEISGENKLILEGSYAVDGSEEGKRMSITAKGFPTKASSILAWYSCPSMVDPTRLSLISSSSDTIVVEIPPLENDAECLLNVSVGTQYQRIVYRYLATKTTTATVSDQGGLSYQIVETDVTAGDFDAVWFTLLDSGDNPTSSRYQMTITKVDDTHCTVAPTGSYLPAGKFKVYAHKTTGFARIPETFTVSFPSTPTATPIEASYVGGKQLTISGAGFSTIESQNNDIRVCGLRANVLSATETDITIQVPPLVTETTQSTYQIADESVLTGTPISDTPLKAPFAFDGSFNTIYTSDNAECYIGYDFGENTVAAITQIRFGPNPQWTIVSTYLDGGVFQGSNDNSVYTQIFAIAADQVHESWNSEAVDSTVHKYRYIRFRHTDTSSCQLATIQISGYKYSTLTVDPAADKSCDVTIATENVVISNAVVYKAASTSTVTAVSPAFGPSIGGQSLTITGTNFGSSIQVWIDGIQCTVDSQTSTQIVCTTGRRSSPPEEGNSFIVLSDGNTAKISSKPFMYGDRWSSQDTWGGEAIPREGDTVYVPKGMTLIVDVESTPVLETIIVEGKIMFSDEKDMTLDASYFVVMGGQFEAGTQEQEYTHQLTITLHGGYYQKQLPMFGNKVLGCLNCIFNMHGKQRAMTWTQVQNTIEVGDNSFTVLHNVDDWLPGQKIAVAATTFDHYETEEMTILSVSDKTITTVQTFRYRHYAAVEVYGGVDFPMRAEVGLLTRNIKVQGSSDSVENKYGSHLMLTGKESLGLVGKVEYAEFTHCGQPSIVGRYCTHFHMAGEVHKSYVRGIAVHHSFARVLTIHGTHFLTVEKNVGYHVEGHNIFVEDGIQTHNIIQDNLMMNSIRSLQMLQSDVTVASYWITNPSNTVRRNHAAGGDFYGFWYEIKEHPDGPSATMDICPQGMRLGESRDNVAHSYKRFGLRIFKLSARKFPCLTTKDESQIDPYAQNPAYESVFENYTLWRNEQCGFLGEQLGYTTIRDIKTADSRKGGMQFHKTNYTKELVVAENCIVVGVSQGNAPAENMDYLYRNARGVIASRTDGLKFSGIKFYNFEDYMTPLQSCSECWNMKLWVTGGKTTFFQNIQYNNIKGSYIFWEKWRREIFIDLDGTLTSPFQTALSLPAQTYATITPYRPSVMIPDHCYRQTDNLWDDSTLCDQTITLRGILFTNGIPKIDFNAIDMKANLLSDPFEDVSAKTEQQFSAEYMIIIKKSNDIKNSWAMPFATNQYYNIHWKWGIDFEHMAVAPSILWNQTNGLVLRFNYTDTRELYDVLKIYNGSVLKDTLITESAEMISPDTCNNGDFYHHRVNFSDPANANEHEYLFVCVSGRNKTIREWIDLNGIRCRETCPKIQFDGDREPFNRSWSNATMWPEGVLPAEGDNVTIPYEWNVVMDIDPAKINYLEVNGYLYFDQSRDNSSLQASYIWVRQGKIIAGTADAPYDKQAHIILHGEKDSRYLLIDPDASGNKMLAVTGGLQLYGIEPETIWTRLVEIAPKSATTIKVLSTTGWNVGDKIVIAPSYSGQKEFEEATITAIDAGTNTVTIDTPLVYEHYGAATATITNQYGQLDARSAVGILNRNIKISPGVDANNWGCRVLIYGYNETHPVDPTLKFWRNGYAKLFGVEFDHCSQYDSTYAAIRIENLEDVESPYNMSITEIEGSSFHDCGGFCFFMDDSQNVSVVNNVFFWARKFIVYVEDVYSNYTFAQNLMVGARKRDEVDLSKSMLVDDIACYEQYHVIPFEIEHNISVTQNLCQGSQGEGFVFPTTPCRYLDTYPFVKNTAGSCKIGYMYEKFEEEQCISAKGAIGYACQIGLMANPQHSALTQMIYEDMFFADSERGMTLRFAHDTDNNTMIFRHSFITGISRMDCPDCYGADKLSYCAGGYAVRSLAVTLTGESFPLKKKPEGHDVICTREAFDFKTFIHNVTFENYFNTNDEIPYCSQMSVFKRHNLASDGTGSNHLTESPCNNCTKKSWAYFDKPNVAWRGWFGGCGDLDCTGPNNYLIYDQDGVFTGEQSQLLSNNTAVGNGEGCEYIPQINGHWCHRTDLAVLEYESIAPDFNKRQMWPVYLKYEGGNWTSETNAWRQWQWDGPQPMNRRLARFWSAIKLHENYNLTYVSQPPSDSRFQIQKRLFPSGNPEDWAIVRIYFPVPNSLQVLVTNSTVENGQAVVKKDQVVKPFVIKQGNPEDLSLHQDFCGANTYHFENGTIEFMVNGMNNCSVRVRLSNFVQLSARININVRDFYNNNGPTTFITNICAFLGIDTGRLKIVGVYEGSAVVVAQLTSPSPNIDDSTTTSVDAAEELKTLTAWADKIKSGVSDKELSLGGDVLEFSAEVHVFNEDGTNYDPEGDVVDPVVVNDQTTDELILPIALGVGVSVVVIAIVAGVIYWKRKRAQVHEEVAQESTVKRQVVQGTTDFDISAIDQFNISSKTNTKWSHKNNM